MKSSYCSVVELNHVIFFIKFHQNFLIGGFFGGWGWNKHVEKTKDTRDSCIDKLTNITTADTGKR